MNAPTMLDLEGTWSSKDPSKVDRPRVLPLSWSERHRRRGSDRVFYIRSFRPLEPLACLARDAEHCGMRSDSLTCTVQPSLVTWEVTQMRPTYCASKQSGQDQQNTSTRVRSIFAGGDLRGSVYVEIVDHFVSLTEKFA